MNQPRTLIFDCDGVILNSNPLKTEAFRQVTKPYGSDATEALVRYHIENGGFSRYKKFSYFLENILGQKANNKIISGLAQQFSERVFEGLLNCPLASGLDQLREKTADSTWMIVSGGDQQELNAVFSQRGIAHYFNGGIFGSPDNKNQILHQQFVENSRAQHPSLFIGDSRYDHQAASQSGCAFVFAYAWTEFSDWKDYCKKNALPAIEKLENLIEFIDSGTGHIL